MILRFAPSGQIFFFFKVRIFLTISSGKKKKKKKPLPDQLYNLDYFLPGLLLLSGSKQSEEKEQRKVAVF
jgi:hypothetical protein